MKSKSTIFVIALSAFLSACETTPKLQMTPLEIQSMQSRTYENTKELVFPSVVSVFQDIGYTITNADIQTGLISAESSSNSDFASKFWLGVTKVSQTKATAFVENINGKAHVRLNFVEVNKTSSGWGQTDRQDTPILRADIYDNAFERIDSALFVRTSQ